MVLRPSPRQATFHLVGLSDNQYCPFVPAPKSLKTIIVTGAAGGLGRAISARLLARGHRVIGADLAGAERTLDVTDPDACRRLATELSPDVWVNNAGVLGAGVATDQPDAEIRRIIEVNLLGVIWGSRAAAQVMRTRGHGHIINVGSLASWLAPIGEVVYAASKHAVRAFTVGLAAELGPSGVQLSLLCPDGIWTPMLAQTLHDPTAAAMSFTARRLLEPTEVAAALAELVDRPRLHAAVPRAKGVGARLVGLSPAVNVLVTRYLERQGARKKARLAERRAAPPPTPTEEP